MFHRTQIKIILIMSAIGLIMMAGLYAVKKSDQNNIAMLLSRQQSDQEALLGKIIELKSKSVKNFANDYTYWDDMVAFVKSGDPVWAEENVEVSMPTFGVDVAWVYRTDLSVVYSSNGFGADDLNQLPLSADILGKIVAKGPFSHFFLLIDAGLLEIFSASIHPTFDEKRKTPPQGYFFIGCLWTETYLKEMSDLSVTDISLAPAGEAQSAAKEKNLDKFILVSTKPLYGWDGTPIINVLSASEAAIPKTMQKHLDAQYLNILAFLVFLLIVLLLILFRLISRPLNLLTKSMADGNPKIIEGLISQKNEFGNLAVMISDFFNQKNRLEKEIAEHEQTEKALLENEEKYRTLVTKSPDGIFIVDLAGTFISVNKTMCDNLKYSEEEFLSMKMWDIVPPQYLALHGARLAAIMKGESKKEAAEYEAIGKDGIIHIIEVLSAPYYKGQEIIGFQGIARDITERKQTEEKLRESDERMSDIINSSSDWVWEVDEKGRYIYSSEKSHDLLGYTHKEIIGKTPFDFMAPEEAERLKTIFSEIISKKEPIKDLENWIIRKNGDRVCHLTNGVPVLDVNGNVKGYRGVDKDITERKRAEEELHAASVRQETVLAAVPDILMEVNNDKVYTWTNPAGLAFFGEHVVGREAAFYFVGEQETYGRVMPLFNGIEEMIYLESWQRRKDGEKRLLAWRCQGLKDTHGNVVGAISSAHDITEQKQAEESLHKSNEILQSEIAERRRAEEELRGTIDRAERSRRSMLSTLEDQRRAGVALRTSEERYRGIFENVQDAYYEAALDGTILEISPSIAILSHGQYHREEVLGRSMNEFYTDPERRGVLLAALREQGAVGDFEIDLRNKDGVLIPCSITSSIRIDATSHEKKVVGSIRDISERKRAQIQMLKDLRTKETLLQELYHRTKNNMQVISSMLHLYGRRISGHEARELFGNIEMKIRSMALVHQKLYESVDLSHVDLKDYFHTLIALLKQSNPSFNAVAVHEELEDVKVLIDTAVPLGMVVSELISNMVKHAFPDKRKAEMKIRLSQTKENTVVLEISDNGVGFAEGFDYRTQANLGLDTVIGLVEDQLNGKITFTSKKGLLCRITLKEEQYQVRI